MSNNITHPYHMVEKSPWPLMASLSAMCLTMNLMYFFFSKSWYSFVSSIMLMVLVSFTWWKNIVNEASMQGLHTNKVMKNMQIGMILFIVSEVLLFFSFFWAFFHSSLTPTLELGYIWPPTNINPFNIYLIPSLNTLILLTSGLSVTWAHHSLLVKSHNQTMISLLMTIILGIYFTLLQGMEYLEASFTMADSCYGSTFFLATGFHGAHVIVGTIMLIWALLRIKSGHMSKNHHTGFEASIWYWHFVDLVWLFLFISIYWWPS